MAGLGPMTDCVSVRDLSVAAVIGVHDWEREVEQTLTVSVDMVADVRKAAAADDLADALDYSAVAAAITAVLREGKFRLIETAAERVADRLLADFPVTALRLELRKPIAAASYTAAVTIERTREGLSPRPAQPPHPPHQAIVGRAVAGPGQDAAHVHVEHPVPLVVVVVRHRPGRADPGVVDHDVEPTAERAGGLGHGGPDRGVAGDVGGHRVDVRCLLAGCDLGLDPVRRGHPGAAGG